MARTEQLSAVGGKGLDLLKEELTKYLGAQVGHLAQKAGDKVSDVTGRLTDITDNGGRLRDMLPDIGSRLLKGGGGPLAAAAKVKGAKDKAVGTAKKAVGAIGGGGKGASAETKVTNIIEVIDVGVPLRTAYDHWTDFEAFSSFTKGVTDVSKDDEEEAVSDWKLKIGPSNRSWKATVQEQVPDDRIVWTSEGPQATTHGAVSFHELGPTLTRIVVVVEYSPSGFLEKTANLWRAQGRRLRLDLKHFQRHVTFAEEEPEAWRGEIRDGEVVRTHDEVMDEEGRGGDEEDTDGEQARAEDEGHPEDEEPDEGDDEEEDEEE
jgi:uncharacterized membrane protein